MFSPALAKELFLALVFVLLLVQGGRSFLLNSWLLVKSGVQMNYLQNSQGHLMQEISIMRTELKTLQEQPEVLLSGAAFEEMNMVPDPQHAVVVNTLAGQKEPTMEDDAGSAE